MELKSSPVDQGDCSVPSARLAQTSSWSFRAKTCLLANAGWAQQTPPRWRSCSVVGSIKCVRLISSNPSGDRPGDDQLALFIEHPNVGSAVFAAADHVNVAPPCRSRCRQIFPDSVTRIGFETAKLSITVDAVDVITKKQRRADHAVQSVGVRFSLLPCRCHSSSAVFTDLLTRIIVEPS